MLTTVVGIDPGLDGGVAILGPTQEAVHPMPIANGEIDVPLLAGLLRSLDLATTVVAIELVHAMPLQGVSSVFTFGKGFGTLLGVTGTLGVRTELVNPAAWKKDVLAGLIPAKPKLPDDASPADKKKAAAAHKKAGKDAAIGWCRKAFPNVSLIPAGCRVAHDGSADALCIAEHARRRFCAPRNQ